MFIAATTDGFVTLAYFGLVGLVACVFGALGERYLMRRDRRRQQIGRIDHYTYGDEA